MECNKLASSILSALILLTSLSARAHECETALTGAVSNYIRLIQLGLNQNVFGPENLKALHRDQLVPVTDKRTAPNLRLIKAIRDQFSLMTPDERLTALGSLKPLTIRMTEKLEIARAARVETRRILKPDLIFSKAIKTDREEHYSFPFVHTSEEGQTDVIALDFFSLEQDVWNESRPSELIKEKGLRTQSSQKTPRPDQNKATADHFDFLSSNGQFWIAWVESNTNTVHIKLEDGRIYSSPTEQRLNLVRLIRSPSGAVFILTRGDLLTTIYQLESFGLNKISQMPALSKTQDMTHKASSPHERQKAPMTFFNSSGDILIAGYNSSIGLELYNGRTGHLIQNWKLPDMVGRKKDRLVTEIKGYLSKNGGLAFAIHVLSAHDHFQEEVRFVRTGSTEVRTYTAPHRPSSGAWIESDQGELGYVFAEYLLDEDLNFIGTRNLLIRPFSFLKQEKTKFEILADLITRSPKEYVSIPYSVIQGTNRLGVDFNASSFCHVDSQGEHFRVICSGSELLHDFKVDRNTLHLTSQKSEAFSPHRSSPTYHKDSETDDMFMAIITAHGEIEIHQLGDQSIQRLFNANLADAPRASRFFKTSDGHLHLAVIEGSNHGSNFKLFRITKDGTPQIEGQK